MFWWKNLVFGWKDLVLSWKDLDLYPQNAKRLLHHNQILMQIFETSVNYLKGTNFRIINFRARANLIQFLDINFRARRIFFQKIALVRKFFQDFRLFYDFLEGCCKNSVLIFAHLNTAYNFGIKFCAFSGLCVKLRENQYAWKLIPLKGIFKKIP